MKTPMETPDYHLQNELANSYLWELQFQEKIIDKSTKYNSEDFLDKAMELYKTIFNLKEGDSYLEFVCRSLGLNKQSALKTIGKLYSEQLSLLKKIGRKNTSYPNKLEDLII